MSSTELYYVTNKSRVIGYAETHNSHLGAMKVWCNLYCRYFEESIRKHKEQYGWEPCSPANDDEWKLLWGLFKKKEIPEYERAVLGSTFDEVILERDHFQRFYDDVMAYAVFYPVGSLIEQVNLIMKLKNRKNIIGVCWNQTSVNGDGFYMLKRKAKDGGLWSLYNNVDRITNEPNT